MGSFTSLARHTKGLSLVITDNLYGEKSKKVVLKGGLEKAAFLGDGAAGAKANSCEAAAGLHGPARQHSPRTC